MTAARFHRRWYWTSQVRLRCVYRERQREHYFSFPVEVHMSNRAVLINAEILTNDPQELEHARLTQGASYVEIGEAANRIPVPWLCCFRTLDLRRVELKRAIGPGRYEIMSLSLPCTSVASARENLSASLPLYVAIAGDTHIGEEYWKFALAGLADLPFEYLTMNPVEVLQLNEPSDEAAALATSLNGTAEAIASMKQLAFIEDGYAPYSFDDFFRGPREALVDDVRINNSAALDPGYHGDEYRIWYRPELIATAAPVPNQPRRSPWWKPWGR
jgi:hypothetical protein